MRIFVDTSAIYALLDRDDQNHLKAKKAWAPIGYVEVAAYARIVPSPP